MGLMVDDWVVGSGVSALVVLLDESVVDGWRNG